MERILAEMAWNISFDGKWSDKTCLPFKHQSILSLMTTGVFSVLAAAEGGSWTSLLKGLCLSNESKFSGGGGWKKYDSLQLPSQTFFQEVSIKASVYTFGSKFLPVFIYSIHPYCFDFYEGVGVGDLVEGCYEFEHKNAINNLRLQPLKTVCYHPLSQSLFFSNYL